MALLHSLSKKFLSLWLTAFSLLLLSAATNADTLTFSSYPDFKNFLLLKMGETSNTFRLGTTLLRDSDVVNGLKLASFKGVNVSVFLEDSGRDHKLWARKILQAVGLSPLWVPPKQLEGKTYFATDKLTYSVVGHLGYFHGEIPRSFKVEVLVASKGFDSEGFWRKLSQLSKPEKPTIEAKPPKVLPQSVPQVREDSVSHSLPKAVKWNSGPSKAPNAKAGGGDN